jgi:SAM-dependent methyltransferase
VSLIQRVLASTRLYDAAQFAAGAGLIRERLRPRLREVGSATVLDVGAGTGIYSACLPDSAKYIWLDNDRHKLRGFLRRGGGMAILGDATRIALADKSVDYSMCTHVAHHLDDQQMGQFLAELARVTRRRIIVQDAIGKAGFRSRVLWSVDKGSYPRGRTELLNALGQRFTIEHTEEYARFHRYLLVVATPKS